MPFPEMSLVRKRKDPIYPDNPLPSCTYKKPSDKETDNMCVYFVEESVRIPGHSLSLRRQQA